ncbi:MAG: hypothetical protein JJU09_06835 [Rhodobacteraceae bacterium]|nr:hypothetical protein [Paracoccaceae bacterium]
MFTTPQEPVCPRRIICGHSRVNGRKPSNLRASARDDAVRLTPPTILSL